MREKGKYIKGNYFGNLGCMCSSLNYKHKIILNRNWLSMLKFPHSVFSPSTWFSQVSSCIRTTTAATTTVI